VTVERAAAQAMPQRIFTVGGGSSQLPRTLSSILSGFAHVEAPPHPALRADLSPQAGRGYQIPAPT
jgi:hypothetical protein